jgi:Peroxidase
LFLARLWSQQFSHILALEKVPENGSKLSQSFNVEQLRQSTVRKTPTSSLATWLLLVLQLQLARFVFPSLCKVMHTKFVQLVADLLVGNADALTSEIITAAPAPLGSDACKKDTCCTWKYVADEMLAKFKGQSFRCNNFARGAIRLGFHDAAGWQKGAAYGGADGSILLTDELSRPVNKGLEEIAVMTKQMFVSSLVTMLFTY